MVAVGVSVGPGIVGAQRSSASPPSFMLSSIPIVSITDDGSDEKQFTRIVARRLSSGEILVGDVAGYELRLFDQHGKFVKRLAVRGKGPGELPGPFRLVVSNDTVFAFGIPPFASPSISVFTVAGHLRTFTPQNDSAYNLQILDRLANGKLLVTRGTSGRVLRAPPAIGQLLADSTQFGLRDATEAVSLVSWFPAVVGEWQIGHAWPRGRLPSTLSPYLNRLGVQAVASGDRLWMVDPESGSIKLFEDNGRQLRVIQLAEQPGRFDPALLAARKARALKAASRPLDTARADVMADASALPTRMPYISSAIAGVAGELWMTRYELDAAAPQRLIVYDKAGLKVAELRVPAGIEVQQIGKDFLVGISRDDDGLLSVVVYRLQRK